VAWFDRNRELLYEVAASHDTFICLRKSFADGDSGEFRPHGSRPIFDAIAARLAERAARCCRIVMVAVLADIQ
jgi:hypothetical protein